MQDILIPISEAYRYIDNAKKDLTENGTVDNYGFYSDKKYMKRAGHTAYTGLLIALDSLMPKKKKGRKNVEDYRKFLGGQDKKMLKFFNSVYDQLHLSCGYDGALNYDIFKAGVQDTKAILEWCQQCLNSK